MSCLVFSRAEYSIELFNSSSQILGAWEAYNNVDSHAKGKWPVGRYDFAYWVAHRGLGVDSAYGTRGVYVFNVPGRSGMGVHAGRKNIGRQKGPRHPTMGCIRTSEEAMAQIQAAHDGGDGLTRIVVQTGRVGDFPLSRTDVMYA